MNETICAISTPPGVGGIAVCRISGPEAISITSKIWRGKNLGQAASHTSHLGTVLDAEGQPLDQCVATLFRGPGSFTGEDTVEISVHGSRYVQSALIASLIGSGARLAEAGEFTRRAFSAGHLDLAQAEAVADIIASQSRAEHRIALNQMRGGYSARLRQLRDKLIELASLLELELDFSEEEVEFADRSALLDRANELNDEIKRLEQSFSHGNAIKNGIPVAIVGQTNVGKSSILNAILGEERAIVSDIHGTTRDLIEDTVNIGDYTFRFIDTAGIRHTDDTIENLGIQRSFTAIGKASIALIVLDPTANSQQSDIIRDTAKECADDANIIIVVNKIDIAAPEILLQNNEIKKAIDEISSAGREIQTVQTSAQSGQGLDQLREAILACVPKISSESDIIVTNSRHRQALIDALAPLQRVIEGLNANLSGDLIAQGLRLVIHHLSSILGDITTADLLSTIFARFCIGK